MQRSAPKAARKNMCREHCNKGSVAFRRPDFGIRSVYKFVKDQATGCQKTGKRTKKQDLRMFFAACLFLCFFNE